MIEINDAVSAVHEEVWAYRDEFIIQKLVVRLYCQIFSFLINVIRWYTDKWHKRLLRSLNENVYDDYKEQVQDIRNLSDLIHRQTTTRRLAEIQASKLILDNENIGFLTRLRERDDHARRMEEEGYFERLRIKLEHSLRDTLEKTVSNVQQSVVDRLLSNVASQIAGAAAMKQLEQGFPMLNMVALRPGKTYLIIIWVLHELIKITEPHSAETLICEQPSSTSISSPTTDDGRITRDAILSSSARLDDFYDYQNTLPSFESLDAFLLADPSVAARMEAFTMSSHSDILHVCGPMEFFEETHSALVSARFATAARASKVPTVSYFCRLSRKTPPPWRTGETIELVGATYALIRQLVELLPNEGVQEFALSDADFGALEGTLDTWDIALKMLNRLLREVVAYQPLLYVIIDGINLLDDVSHGSTDRPLRGLVSLLQGCAEKGGRHLMKMLFTTAGESRALNSALDSRNTVKSCM